MEATSNGDEDDVVDEGAFVTAAVSPASTAGTEDERRRLLTDQFFYSSPTVVRLLQVTSGGTVEGSVSDYDTAPIHRRTSGNSTTTSPSSLANGSTVQLDSVTNDFASVVTTPTIHTDLDYRHSSTDSNFFWHPHFLRPQKVHHPLQESLVKGVFVNIGQFMVAIFFGIPLFVVFCILLTFVIPLRLMFYVITRFSFRGAFRTVIARQHCFPLWPLSVGAASNSSNIRTMRNAEHVMLMATMEGGLEATDVRRAIWRKLVNAKNYAGYLLYPKLSQYLSSSGAWIPDEEFDINNHINVLKAFDEKRPVKNLKDLELFLAEFYSESFNIKRPLWRICLITNFGDSQCMLVVVKMHAILADQCFCPAKMICLLNDESIRFDTEPHVRRNVPIVPLFFTMSMYVWRCVNTCGTGLCEFVINACRRMSPVWTCIEKQRKSSTTSNPTSRMFHQKVTWARIPSADQLLRVERILRCTTEELLLSFISGALRRFFRSRGIKHPPDFWVSVPLTFRDFMSISKGQPCNFSLVPMKLPVSIEGVVPRLWATQQRMYALIDSAFPRAANCIGYAAKQLLPKSWTRRLMALPHRCCDGYVSFLRSGGELSMCRRRIYSLLMYSSLVKPVGDRENYGKFGFTFVQIGHEIVLSLSVDSTVFPDPDNLIRFFQCELHSLLRLLAPRMLTLSQATFLPAPFTKRKPSSEPSVEPLGQVSTGSKRKKRPARTSHPNLTVNTSITVDGAELDEVSESDSVEELETLLTTVQNELLQMESNPKGNRTEYINKLAQLEIKMEAFHRSITDKLEKSGRHMPKTPDGKELNPRPAWDNVLQPYKDEETEPSNEPTREGSVRKLMRKRSKRLSSPTRLSPQCSQEFLSEIP